MSEDSPSTVLAGPLPSSDRSALVPSDSDLLLKAMRRGWPIPDATRTHVINWLKSAVLSKNPETKMAAVKIALEAEKHNLKLVEVLDKIDRLDRNQPTEIQRVVIELDPNDGFTPQLPEGNHTHASEDHRRLLPPQREQARDVPGGREQTRRRDARPGCRR